MEMVDNRGNPIHADDDGGHHNAHYDDNTMIITILQLPL